MVRNKYTGKRGFDEVQVSQSSPGQGLSIDDLQEIQEHGSPDPFQQRIGGDQQVHW